MTNSFLTKASEKSDFKDKLQEFRFKSEEIKQKRQEMFNEIDQLAEKSITRIEKLMNDESSGYKEVLGDVHKFYKSLNRSTETQSSSRSKRQLADLQTDIYSVCDMRLVELQNFWKVYSTAKSDVSYNEVKALEAEQVILNYESFMMKAVGQSETISSICSSAGSRFSIVYTDLCPELVNLREIRAIFMKFEGLMQSISAETGAYWLNLKNMQLNCPTKRTYKESFCDELYDLESADGRYVKSVCYKKEPNTVEGAFTECISAGMSPYFPNDGVQADLKNKLPNVPKAWVNGFKIFESFIGVVNGGTVFLPAIQTVNTVEGIGFLYMANNLNDIVMVENNLEQLPYLCEFINGVKYYEV